MGRNERVARALRAAEQEPWDSLTQDDRTWYLDLARDAIAAMREPELPDDEVWSCACCHQIVDRDTMAAVHLINAN